uniref:Trafficking protein particle complex subunit 2-like protein n=1 Tax=Anopheles maculatus TaxID=74869 RepID=A0A182TB86_9DIPT
MCACVAIIGKDNAPLYIATANVDKEIALQYQVHASLDVIDERCATNQKAAADGRELYLGSLISTEQYKIYGYVTNTKIKFLIVIDASSTSSFRENEVRAMFRNLHNLYTDAVCNPFYTPGEPLTSASFDRANIHNIHWVAAENPYIVHQIVILLFPLERRPNNSESRKSVIPTPTTTTTSSMPFVPSEVTLPLAGAGAATGLFGSIVLLRLYKLRKWGWVKSNYSLEGKTFVITGANTGLGYETTKALVRRQATIVMACRNLNKANEAIGKIRTELGGTIPGALIPMELDLASFRSIRNFTSELKRTIPQLYCLVNNAGLAVREPEFTAEKYEVHFGVNHLGQFLLVDLLKQQLLEQKTRVVVVSSRMHEIEAEIDFAHLGRWVEYNSRLNRLYNNSKLMNFYYARELYKRGFNVHVLCPGLCHTDFFRHYEPKWYHYLVFSPIVWLMLRSGEQVQQLLTYTPTPAEPDGAQNIIYAATESVTTPEQNPVTGYFISNVKMRRSKFHFDEETSVRLWDESVRAIAESEKNK